MNKERTKRIFNNNYNKGIRQLKKGCKMDVSEIIDKCISSEVTEKESLNLLDKYKIDKENRTYKTLIIVNLIELATKGDYKAINLIMQVLKEKENDFLNW